LPDLLFITVVFVDIITSEQYREAQYRLGTGGYNGEPGHRLGNAKAVEEHGKDLPLVLCHHVGVCVLGLLKMLEISLLSTVP
jgi:hypothetical protein